MFKNPFKMTRDRSSSICNSSKPREPNETKRSSTGNGNQAAHPLTSPRSLNRSETQALDGRMVSCSSENSSNVSMCRSTLSQDERRHKILKFWDKKIQRANKKKQVRYHCRKDLADNRFRYHGRFISKEQMEKILEGNKHGMDEIYNPYTKCTPKTKQIFKVERHAGRNASCFSAHCHSRQSNGFEGSSGEPLDDIGLKDSFPQEDLDFKMHQFPTMAVQQTLFGAETQNMRLTAGVQKVPMFGERDVGIEHPFAGSQQCSNIGPLNPMQENPQQNLLLPASDHPTFGIPNKDPSEALQPKLNPFGFDQEQPLL